MRSKWLAIATTHKVKTVLLAGCALGLADVSVLGCVVGFVGAKSQME